MKNLYKKIMIAVLIGLSVSFVVPSIKENFFESKKINKEIVFYKPISVLNLGM